MAIQVLNPYASHYTGAQIDQAVNFVHTQVAEPFSATKAYNAEDFVVYEGLLYSAKTDLAAGAFNVNNWNIQKIFDNDGYVIIQGGNAPQQ